MWFLRDRFINSVLIFVVVIVGGMLIVRGCGYKQAGFDPEQKISVGSSRGGSQIELPKKGPFRITQVIDGDTIVLDNGENIRLIGVDTPETHHPELPVQRFGEEAADFLRKLAEGAECMLEYEPRNVRDKYNRLLAYVFVNNKLVNAELIRRGYAYAYIRFPFQRQQEFIVLEREARQNQYGLWNLSLRDGRIAHLVNQYESLNPQGRSRLDDLLKELVEQYPLEQIK